jgi:hypothetical protein
MVVVDSCMYVCYVIVVLCYACVCIVLALCLSVCVCLCVCLSRGKFQLRVGDTVEVEYSRAGDTISF